MSDVSETVTRRAEARARRLALATAIWGASGLDDRTGSRTVQAELRGLAGELQGNGLDAVAAVLEQAAEALSCLSALAGAEESAHGGRRVLLLDDSEVTRDLIALALDGLGCVVGVAEDVASCVDRLDDFDPDALILDPSHPDLATEHGRSVLLGHVGKNVLPVLLFSSDGHETLEPHKKAYKADAVISKDQGLEEMLHQVDEVLSGIIW